MIKESIHWEDKTTINMCTPNSRATKYMKQTLVEFK